MPSAARPTFRWRSAVAVALVIFSVISLLMLGRIPIDLPPSPQALRLNIDVAVPGLTAYAIEEHFTYPLERALDGIPNVTRMDSVTYSGGLNVDLHLAHRWALESVRRDVLMRLGHVRGWSDAIDPPTISVIDPTSKIAEFTVHSRTRGPLALRDWAEDDLARRLRELPGVGTVEVEGGHVREILIMPDQRRLAGNGLDFADVLRAIRQNPEIASSAVASTATQRRTRPLPPGSMAGIAALPVPLPDGDHITLSEVARLAQSQVPDPSPVRIDGREAVRVHAHKLPLAALSDVGERVRMHVDWMHANRLIPEGIEIDRRHAQLDELRRPMRHMVTGMLVGLALILAAAQWMWGSGRRSLVLGAVVVLTVQATILILFLVDTALDILVLGALVSGAGLFAGSVLMMFETSSPVGVARHDGINPIAAAAAIAVTLAPAGLMGGDLVRYREFILVFAASAVFAAALARWLVPLYDRARPHRTHGLARLMTRAYQAYDRVLHKLMARSAAVLTLVAVLLTVSVAVPFLSIRTGVAPEGVEDRLLRIHLKGPSYTGLLGTANAVTERLESLAPIRRAEHSARLLEEAWVLRPRPELVDTDGVDLAAIGRALAVARQGIHAGNVRDVDQRYQVRMRLPSGDATDVAAGKILLLGELPDRPAVYLRDLVTIERSAVPARIRHHNGQPIVEIEATVADGYSARTALNAAKTSLSDVDAASGNKLYFGPAGARAQEQLNVFMRLLGVSLTLVFLMLGLWYRAWRPALVVILTAGTAVIVTLLAMRYWQSSLSVSHWLGVYLLFGVTAAHAMLGWKTTTASLREIGSRWHQMTRRRFRLVSAMTLAAIVGLLPLLWIDAGLRSVAGVLIFGLAVSWVLNLWLSPLLYWWFLGRNKIGGSSV